MSNNKQLQTALEIAVMAHKGVTRRNTDPYIFHVLRVAVFPAPLEVDRYLYTQDFTICKTVMGFRPLSR